VVTIKGNSKEVIGRGLEQAEKFVLQFRELKKPFVLNKTNGKVLAKLFGTDEMDQWSGRRVSLYVKDDVEFQGEVVSAIRVRPTLHGEPKKEPFSAEAFMTKVDQTHNASLLWNFFGELNQTNIGEDDKVSLSQYVFKRIDELKGPKSEVS